LNIDGIAVDIVERSHPNMTKESQD